MITSGALYAAFRGLRKKASAGVDGVTYEEYERNVAGNIQTLHERLKNGKYQAQPLRRVYSDSTTKTNRPRKVAVGTVKKSMAAVCAKRFVREVRQVCEGGLRDRGKYLATVDCATTIPNLSSSP
jgi:phage terminase large subunit-like protein